MVYIKRKIKWGNILVAINKNIEITGLWFEGQKYFPSLKDACFVEELSQEELASHEGGNLDFQALAKLIKDFELQIKQYEEGTLKVFDLPLAPEGTEFRQKVWQKLLEIPYGKTTSYGSIGKEIALEQGKETMSAQAIGGAVGHNPISLIIPCHRVLGAKGQLTGYAGGVDKKVAILQHEGVQHLPTEK